MTKDSNTPATKADFEVIQNSVESLETSVQSLQASVQAITEAVAKLYDANQQWKDEIIQAYKVHKDELIHHFDVVTENQHADLIGAFGDRYESLREVQQRHGRRLNRLESR